MRATAEGVSDESFMMGAHFGGVSFSTRMRVSGTGARSTDWLSDTAVQARATFGVGGSYHTLLSFGVNIKEGSLSQSFSFDADLVKRLHHRVDVSASPLDWQVNTPGSIRASVTVIGSDFGAVRATSQMRHLGGGPGGGLVTLPGSMDGGW